jgi:di/tricarboxylate transporter
MPTAELTLEMMVVLGVLGLTVILLVTEIVRIDVTAILIMVLLGLLSNIPGLDNLADVRHLFDGVASNAVIAIIAVMILGAGLDKTGLMLRIASMILRFGGSTEKRLLPIVCGSVGFVSSFVQNVGAAALFLPVVSRISARTDIPMARLLMPMGFCAILGGTITMVGSSPLILLNDLIISSNADLPDSMQMHEFSLFSVLPVGLALTAAGILYFVFLGRWILPGSRDGQDASSGQSIREYLKRLYGLNADIFEVAIPEGSLLLGEKIGEIMEAHHLYVIGYYDSGTRIIAPKLTNKITSKCRIAILGQRETVQEMCYDHGLTLLPALDVFAEDFAATKAGVAEIVVPANSSFIGQTAREMDFRQSLGLSLLAIHRTGNTFSYVESEDHEATRIGVIPLQAGDTLVVHTPWERLIQLKKNRNLVVVTTDFPQEEMRPKKVSWAVFFFLLALAMMLFTDLRLSLCLMTGAIGIIITRVLSMDEAYDSVSWNTVFMLASLIPLGQAVQATGTAEWIANEIVTILDGWPVWALQTAVAVLSTAFTLVMSNVGATVLLVPLAVSIAVASGGDPSVFALTVAISTSNSFLIPTNQVNALIMGPAGYRVIDFVRIGGMMTVLYLVVTVGMMNLVF